MNVLLNESGYTLDGKWRLVPVEITDEMEWSAFQASSMESQKPGIINRTKASYTAAIKSAPPPHQQSPWQPIVTPIENGRRVIVASSNRMALFHGQFRKYPFPRIVANDGSYITEFYAWMYEPELPPLPDPAP